MMTDRELLVSAAKAAGYGELRILDDSSIIVNSRRWNPLADDGDAFRLAVKLGITIAFVAQDSYTGDPNVARARYWDCGEVDEHFDDCTDQYAATRRAVVRGAAEIGKNVDAPQNAG